MVTTARDLLDQAQAEAWELVRGITIARRPNLALDWEELRAIAAEWPQLAAASSAAMREALGLHPAAPGTTRSLQLLEQTAQDQSQYVLLPGHHTEGRISAETQSRMARMSQLLHATSDLLVSARQRGDFTPRHEADGAEISDRIARIAAAAATVTQIRLERVTPNGTIGARRHFAELSQAPRHQAPQDTQRPGGLDLIAAAAPGEATLDTAINRWETAARHTLEQPVLDPDAMRYIAVAAAAVNAARGDVLQHPDVLGSGAAENSMAHRSSMRARDGWRALEASWPSHIRGAGRADVTTELREASAGLHAQLAPLLNGSHPDPVGQLPALTRALRPIDRIGQEYRTAVSAAVERETFLVPARQLTRQALNADPRLAAESRRGRWVRLPKAEPAGQELVRAAHGAERLARQAAEQVIVRSTSLPRAPEPVRARTRPGVGPSAGVER